MELSSSRAIAGPAPSSRGAPATRLPARTGAGGAMGRGRNEPSGWRLRPTVSAVFTDTALAVGETSLVTFTLRLFLVSLMVI